MVYLPAIEAVGITIPSTTVARAKASCICSSVIVNIQFYDKSSYLYYQELENLRIILLVRDYLQVASILVSHSLKWRHLALSPSIPILSVISVPDLGLS